MARPKVDFGLVLSNWKILSQDILLTRSSSATCQRTVAKRRGDFRQQKQRLQKLEYSDWIWMFRDQQQQLNVVLLQVQAVGTRQLAKYFDYFVSNEGFRFCFILSGLLT